MELSTILAIDHPYCATRMIEDFYNRYVKTHILSVSHLPRGTKSNSTQICINSNKNLFLIASKGGVEKKVAAPKPIPSRVKFSNLPHTREEARNIGSKYYFTGRPCNHGHISKRLTSNGSCFECVRLDEAKNCHTEWDKLPKRRRDAIKLGYTFYFTGKPCKHGHIAPRLAYDGKCIGCKNEVIGYSEEYLLKKELRDLIKNFSVETLHQVINFAKILKEG